MLKSIFLILAVQLLSPLAQREALAEGLRARVLISTGV